MGKLHMTELERTSCITMYAKGATLDELAEYFDRHRTTINRLIKRKAAQRGHKFRMLRKVSRYYRSEDDKRLRFDKKYNGF